MTVFPVLIMMAVNIEGSGYLGHAISLFLRYKPAPEDLRYFLEFQVPIQWAPLFCELTLGHQRRKTSCPLLQIPFLGPKIPVSSTQVTSDKKPAVGLRLFFEREKCNRMAIHAQYLSSLPNIMELALSNSTTSRPCQWRGSDDYVSNDQFLEPVRWKRDSNLCSSIVKHDLNWIKGKKLRETQIKQGSTTSTTSTRTRTMVQMQRVAIGRDVDSTSLEGYDDLITELEILIDDKKDLGLLTSLMVIMSYFCCVHFNFVDKHLNVAELMELGVIVVELAKAFGLQSQSNDHTQGGTKVIVDTTLDMSKIQVNSNVDLAILEQYLMTKTMIETSLSFFKVINCSGTKMWCKEILSFVMITNTATLRRSFTQQYQAFCISLLNSTLRARWILKGGVLLQIISVG